MDCGGEDILCCPVCVDRCTCQDLNASIVAAESFEQHQPRRKFHSSPTLHNSRQKRHAGLFDGQLFDDYASSEFEYEDDFSSGSTCTDTSSGGSVDGEPDIVFHRRSTGSLLRQSTDDGEMLAYLLGLEYFDEDGNFGLAASQPAPSAGRRGSKDSTDSNDFDNADSEDEDTPLLDNLSQSEDESEDRSSILILETGSSVASSSFPIRAPQLLAALSQATKADARQREHQQILNASIINGQLFIPSHEDAESMEGNGCQSSNSPSSDIVRAFCHLSSSSASEDEFEEDASDVDEDSERQSTSTSSASFQSLLDRSRPLRTSFSGPAFRRFSEQPAFYSQAPTNGFTARSATPQPYPGSQPVSSGLRPHASADAVTLLPQPLPTRNIIGGGTFGAGSLEDRLPKRRPSSPPQPSDSQSSSGYFIELCFDSRHSNFYTSPLDLLHRTDSPLIIESDSDNGFFDEDVMMDSEELPHPHHHKVNVRGGATVIYSSC